MNLMWTIYWIDTFSGNPIPTFPGLWPPIIILLIGIAAAYVVAIAATLLGDSSDKKEAEEFIERLNPVAKKFFSSKLLWGYTVWSLIIAPGINTLIPNKDTAYKMLAAYTVTDIATNKKVQELGSKSLEVVEQAMDRYLNKDRIKDSVIAVKDKTIEAIKDESNKSIE